MVLSVEDQTEIRCGHPGLLRLRQCLHVEVWVEDPDVSFSCTNDIQFRVNLSVAVVAMTSNKTHIFPNGTQATVSLFIVVYNTRWQKNKCIDSSNVINCFSILILTGTPTRKAWSSPASSTATSSPRSRADTSPPSTAGRWPAEVLNIKNIYCQQKYLQRIFLFGITTTALLTLVTPALARMHTSLLVAVRVISGLSEGMTYLVLTSAT